MATIKQVALESIKRMPEESTAEEIMYKIHFISQVLKGLKDANDGKTLSTEELLQRIEKWAK